MPKKEEVSFGLMDIRMAITQSSRKHDFLSPCSFPDYKIVTSDLRESYHTYTSAVPKASPNTVAPAHSLGSFEKTVITKREDSPVHSPLLG